MLITKKPSKKVVLLFFAVFGFNFLFAQQKITIKNQDEIAVGHFIVETFHEENGKLKLIEGSIPEFESSSGSNNCVISISNLIWYDPDQVSSIKFEIDKINIGENKNVIFPQQGSSFTLHTQQEGQVDIELSLNAYGDYRMNIPFVSEMFQGRFMQFLSVSGPENLAVVSKSIKKDWKEVDKDDLEAVRSFLSKYENNETGKKYINDAERVLFKLERIAESELKPNVLNKDGTRNLDQMETDLGKIVNSDAEISYINELGVKDRKLYLQIDNEEIFELELSEKEIPIQIHLLTANEEESSINEIVAGIEFEKDTMIKINEQMLIDNNIQGSFNSVELFNALNAKVFERPISEISTIKKNYSSLLVMVLIGLLGLIGGFVYWNNKKQTKKKEVLKKIIAEKVSQHQATIDNDLTDYPDKHEVSPSNKKTIQKIKINQNPKPKESNVPVTGNGRIKILNRKIQNRSQNEEQFAKLINDVNCVKVNLGEIWNETAIQDVHMSEVFINELDQFLAESSTNDIKNELQGAIPEVGGFLMGRYTEKSNLIDLIIEKFVPFVPEYNDVFKIEIGTKTLVEELGDAQDKFPNLDVIGWFHTHPGHGLFLSISDLGVQRHFPKQFQVAMEIDSLTKDLDMSLFSRQMNGKINNTQNRIAGKEWFKWVDIEQRIRQNI